MNSIQKLPKKIEQEIEIYLGQEEKMLKSLYAIGENNNEAGKVWLILTNHSIFFHTAEKNKESVVALLSRKNIKLIEYFQKASEIMVTFIPASNPKNTTKISFPIKRKELLEDFCEDLADLIDFKKETGSGVKIYSRTPKPKASIKSSLHKIKADEKPLESETKKVDNKVKLSHGFNTSDNKTREEEYPPVQYVILATVVSVIVAFIWYKFFKMISSPKHYSV